MNYDTAADDYVPIGFEANGEIDWEAGGHVHNWRTHVPDEIRKAWHTFSPDNQRLLARWADSMAGDEVWD